MEWEEEFRDEGKEIGSIPFYILLHYLNFYHFHAFLLWIKKSKLPVKNRFQSFFKPYRAISERSLQFLKATWGGNAETLLC